MANIAILSNELTGGGAERSMNLLANELTHLGHKVKLIVMKNGESDLVPLQCEVISLNLPQTVVPFPLLKKWLTLQKIFRDFRPDVTILNCDLPEFLGSISHGMGEVFVVEHNSKPWITRKLIGYVTRVVLVFRNVEWISVSKAFRIWPFNLKPLEVINNPIFLDRNIADYSGPIRRLVHVGRLTHQKNPEFIVELASILNLPILVIGDGEARTDLEMLCSELNVQAHFCGFVANPWLEFLPGDLLLIASRFEGDALVPIEAVANRIPLLLSDIPEFRVLNLSSENYISDLTKTAALIRATSDVSKFRISNQVAELILSQRSADQVAQRWSQIFKLKNPHFR